MIVSRPRKKPHPRARKGGIGSRGRKHSGGGRKIRRSPSTEGLHPHFVEHDKCRAFAAHHHECLLSDGTYQSGQVFHIDATVAQHLPWGKGLIGIDATGFYLQQTTGDSGSGARLDSFEEMTAGVGPVLSYAAQFGKIGFAASLKWLPQIGRAEHPERRLRLVQTGGVFLMCDFASTGYGRVDANV
jgi:hypothetical protein